MRQRTEKACQTVRFLRFATRCCFSPEMDMKKSRTILWHSIRLYGKERRNIEYSGAMARLRFLIAYWPMLFGKAAGIRKFGRKADISKIFLIGTCSYKRSALFSSLSFPENMPGIQFAPAGCWSLPTRFDNIAFWRFEIIGAGNCAFSRI